MWTHDHCGWRRGRWGPWTISSFYFLLFLLWATEGDNTRRSLTGIKNTPESKCDHLCVKEWQRQTCRSSWFPCTEIPMPGLGYLLPLRSNGCALGRSGKYTWSKTLFTDNSLGGSYPWERASSLRAMWELVSRTCWCFLSISSSSPSTFVCFSFTFSSSSSLAWSSSSWRVTCRSGFT